MKYEKKLLMVMIIQLEVSKSFFKSPAIIGDFAIIYYRKFCFIMLSNSLTHLVD